MSAPDLKMLANFLSTLYEPDGRVLTHREVPINDTMANLNGTNTAPTIDGATSGDIGVFNHTSTHADDTFTVPLRVPMDYNQYDDAMFLMFQLQATLAGDPTCVSYLNQTATGDFDVISPVTDTTRTITEVASTDIVSPDKSGIFLVNYSGLGLMAMDTLHVNIDFGHIGAILFKTAMLYGSQLVFNKEIESTNATDIGR